TEPASIAAGNVVTVADDPALYVPPPYTQISGVAPCAALRSYNVCAQVGCTVAQVLAGVENILIDGDVDVVVHGFSGGESPWSDVDRAFLDLVAAGILVVAPAGNISAASPQPEGTDQHRAPWLLTVAGSSHDEAVLNGSVTATGPGVPAPATQSVLLVPAVGGPFGAAGNLAIRIDSANPEGCSAAGGFPAGHFDNAVALVPHPGNAAQCSFTEK